MKRLLVLIFIVATAYSTLGQNEPKKVALLWDVSYSMRNKDVQKEFKYLDSYFNQNPEVNLQLKTFSNTVIFEANYTISNGNWAILRSELAKTVYDGSANFNDILNVSATEIILITDGRAQSSAFPNTAKVPVNVISSLPDANESALRSLALSTGGVFINAKDYESTVASKLETITVSGYVSDSEGPLGQVAIYSRETKTSAVSNEDGSYSISAKVGGVLEYSYLGKNTVLSRAPESGIKNIKLTNGNEVLDEVVLTAAGEVDTENVDTGFGTVNKRTLGYSVESITDEDVSEQDINIETAIQGQFSNINLKGDQDISQFLSRGAGMSILLDQTGLIVVDGVPIESSPSALRGLNSEGDKGIFSGSGLLDPENIADITVLKGLAATNKYGTLGRNGVILITTKTFATSKSKNSGSEVILGTTATYDGSAESMAAIPDSPYILALRKATDIDDAYQIYLEQRKKYGSTPAFFIDVASYFNNWNNPYLVSRVLSNVTELAPDLAFLRAQAYKFEEFGLFQEAVNSYEQLVKQAPAEIQNYRNLALALHQVGKIQEALEIYKQIDNKTMAAASDFGELRKTVVKEFKNLIAQNKGNIDLQDVNSFYKNNITYTARVVFEWSDYDAEFDLQIVNPQNRFFTWSHTQESEAVRMNQEAQLGYGLEEYFMTSQDKGEWLFNITYKGKRNGDNATPTYLKITSYKNFGNANQTQEIKVVSLYELNKKNTVKTITIE